MFSRCRLVISSFLQSIFRLKQNLRYDQLFYVSKGAKRHGRVERRGSKTKEKVCSEENSCGWA